MNKLESIIKRLQLIQNKQYQICLNNTDVKNMATELNRDEQLFKKGENTDGEVIGYYSKATEKLSKGRKKKGQKYDFKDTGDFLESMETIYKNKIGLIIDADTQKDDEDIAKKYDKLLGLSDENLAKVRSKSKNVLISEALRMLRKS